MIELVTRFFIPVAHAANTASTSWSLENFNFVKMLNQNTSAAGLISTAINALLIIVGLTAFVMLIFAGFQYITAGGDAEKATKARTGILNALIGVIVVVVAYTLVSFAGGFLTGNY